MCNPFVLIFSQNAVFHFKANINYRKARIWEWESRVAGERFWLFSSTRFAPEWKHSRDEASRNGYSQNQPSMKNQPFPIDGNWPAANAWMKGVDSGKALTSD
jgi:hypothetical protein